MLQTLSSYTSIFIFVVPCKLKLCNRLSICLTALFSAEITVETYEQMLSFTCLTHILYLCCISRFKLLCMIENPLWRGIRAPTGPDTFLVLNWLRKPYAFSVAFIHCLFTDSVAPARSKAKVVNGSRKPVKVNTHFGVVFEIQIREIMYYEVDG